MINKIYVGIKDFMKDNYKSLIALIVIFLLFMIELPYSIYTPGGAVDLNERIMVEDGSSSTGSFNMAYVSMVKGSTPFLLLSYIIPDWDIVKKDNITIEGENMDDMLAREKLYMQESIDAAIINAYKEAGKKLTITNTIHKVSYIAEDASTDLKIGDQIISVNGESISSLQDLKNKVNTFVENDVVKIKIKRNNKEKEASAKVYKTSDGLKIGVSLITNYEYDSDPKITVKSKASEAGSSGGLMMSLTIYNKLTDKDITKGKKIVGTGTIDIDGNVGEIGGVKYKLIGAVKNKAEIFICPVENYEEAKKVAKERNYDIKIISASTFQEVLEKLEEL